MGVIVRVRRLVVHVSPAEACDGALACPHAAVALKADQQDDTIHTESPTPSKLDQVALAKPWPCMSWERFRISNMHAGSEITDTK